MKSAHRFEGFCSLMKEVRNAVEFIRMKEHPPPFLYTLHLRKLNRRSELPFSVKRAATRQLVKTDHPLQVHTGRYIHRTFAFNRKNPCAYGPNLRNPTVFPCARRHGVILTHPTKINT